MCGFSGIISSDKISKDRLFKISKSIKHRGPDAEGICKLNSFDKNIGFVHRRLAIQDLTQNGKQPMSIDQNKITILFNGEIYNFKEIRNHYLKYEEFISETDTEVIVRLYKKFGIESINYLNGMFSIVICDLNINKIYLIRDRVGVKPLYYGFINNEFRFGSELKGLIENDKFNIDKQSLQLFLQFGYIPFNKSIFESINKVEPGAYLEFDIQKFEYNKIQYWDLKNEITKINKSDNSLVEEKITDVFKKSFLSRMISDVPVGVLQSGGYDSTLLTAVLSNCGKDFKNFTIGFDKRNIDESNDAQKISNHFGIENDLRICTEEDALKIIDKIAMVFDEPFGDPSSIPTIFLNQFVSETHKVVLSADGGDEIFGGYDKHRWVLNINKHSNKVYTKFLIILLRIINILLFPVSYSGIIKIRNINTRISKIIEILKANKITRQLEILSKYIPDYEIGNWVNYTNFGYSFDLFEPNCASLIDKILCIDIQTHLPDQIMVKVDRSSMFSSVEAREPLLDHKLILYAFSINPELKINGQHGKYILKNTVWKFINKNIIEKKKQGFCIPLRDWMAGPLKPLIDKLISKERLSPKLFNVDYITKYKDDVISGKNLSERKLWHIFMFQIWFEQWKKNITEDCY